jgi:ribosomal protein S18 acetylase RimI-like enzyme
MDVTIGDLRVDEAPAAIALWEQCGLTRPWNDPLADLRLALAGPTSTVLAARDAAALVGTAMVGVDGHRGWVYYLGVAPRARRNGLGRALMGACEAWVVARGHPKLQLMVRSENAATLAFYEALGYAVQDSIVLGKRFDGR